MRQLDLNKNQGIERYLLKKYDTTKKNFFQTETHDGGVFTNFQCTGNSNDNQISSVLKKDAIHFVYPNTSDVFLKINGNVSKSLLCPANKTSVFSNRQFVKYGVSLQGNDTQKISILSIDYPSFKAYRDVLVKNISEHNHSLRSDSLFPLQFNSVDERISKTIKKISKLCNIEKPNNLILNDALIELQYIFIQYYLMLNNESVLSHAELQKIKDLPFIITNQAHAKLTVEKLASQIDMEPEVLQLGCEIVFKIGTIALINQIKLERIAEQLLKKTCNLADIVYDNGYTSRSYFYKIFNERYQCHPKAYKKSHA